MKASGISIGALLVAIGLVIVSSPAAAQQPNGNEVKRLEPARSIHGSRGADLDFAAARADAHAKANARQSTDVDVNNKLGQKQAAIGIGTGGRSSVNLKNNNTNVNTLKTGDVVNLNVNDNKQIQTFGLPFGRALTPVR